MLPSFWIALVLAAGLSGAPEGSGTPPPRQAPAAADARRAAAARALSAGDLDRALALAQRHVEADPGDRRARVLLARVHLERRDPDAAYVELRRVLIASPRDVDALYYLALATAELAGAEFERLVALAPDSGRARQLMAESLESQDRARDAEREYEAAVAAQPDLLDPLLGLARLKRIRLACEEAVPLYERAEHIRPTFDGAYGLGVCQQYLQNDEVAAAAFERAVKRDPKAAVAWVGLGTTLTRLGRPADGITRLQRAIELEPRMGEAYYALGLALRAAGQPERAKEAFARAEALGTR